MADIPSHYDAVVIGSSWAGIWMLYELKKLKLNSHLFELQSDVGGVWNSHSYPGCRVDTEVPFYEFSDPELWKDWTWTERFPLRAEVQQYMSYACDKLELRALMTFQTYVSAAYWDDKSSCWELHTKNGLLCTTNYFIPACGYSSIPYYPDYPGRGTFPNAHHISCFPHDLDCTGKRVGIIGTGASGVQLIEELAPIASHLTVFQRTPNLATPRRQKSFTPDDNIALKTQYPLLFDARFSRNGVDNFDLRDRVLDNSTADRETFWHSLWTKGGLSFWFRNYADIFTDKSSNLEAYRFWRSQTVTRIIDGATAALLAPEDPPHAFGIKRPSLETSYFESFNLGHVKLVDLRADPIASETSTGIRCVHSGCHTFDVLVYATGYDYFETSLLRFDIYGARGIDLKVKWDNHASRAGIWTYLGLCTSGFPNMFFPMGPQGPSALGITPHMAEIQGAFIAGIIAHAKGKGYRVIEATAEAEEQWKVEVEQAASETLFPLTDSWYMGVNIPGRKREARCFFGGVDVYINHLQDKKCEGWSGFSFS